MLPGSVLAALASLCVGPSLAANSSNILGLIEQKQFDARYTECAAFSPTREHLIIAGNGGKAWLYQLSSSWSADNLQLISTHNDPSYYVRDVAISFDGAQFCTGGDDGKLRLYRLEPESSTIQSVAVINDAAGWFSWVGGPKWLSLGGMPPAPMGGGWFFGNAIVATAFSPAGDRLCAASLDGKARIYTLGGDRPVLWATLKDAMYHPLNAVAFSPCGNLLCTAGEDGSARLYSLDSSSPQLWTRLDEARGYLYSSSLSDAAFSPDGLLLGTAGSDGVVRLYNLSGKLPSFWVKLTEAKGSKTLSLVFSPSSRWLYVVATDKARLYELGEGPSESPTILTTIDDVGIPLMSLAFSPDEQRVFTIGDNGTGWLYGLPSEEELTGGNLSSDCRWMAQWPCLLSVLFTSLM